MKIVLIAVLILLVIGIVLVLVFVGSSPKFEPEFFEYSYIDKYSSPVDLYENYVKFLKTKNPKIWEEMIGRKLKENEKLPELQYRGLPPSIQEYKIEREHATIVTNDGERIEMDFVKGRWVLTQKNSSFYIRKFFRSLKSSIKDLVKRAKGEKTEKIVAPSQR
jgi:hypothetical protein